MLENEEKILLDLENVHHQGKYKIGRFSSWIKAFKSDRARSVNKADYRNQIDTESFRPEEDKTPKTGLFSLISSYYLDSSSKYTADLVKCRFLIISELETKIRENRRRNILVQFNSRF